MAVRSPMVEEIERVLKVQMIENKLTECTKRVKKQCIKFNWQCNYNNKKIVNAKEIL